MNIRGSGTILAGEYNQKISISGGGKIDGNIRCIEFSCAGSARGKGNIDCSGDVSVAGSMTLEGCLTGKTVRISGSGKIAESCTAKDELKIAGGFKAKSAKASTLHCAGSMIVEEGIEAEKARISGTINCAGLLNAESVEIVMEAPSSNKIGSIGGSYIKIYPKIRFQNIRDSRMPLLSRLIGVANTTSEGITQISESIEGDTIALENVKAPLVIGRIVAIGSGCEIGLVQYSETIEIDPNAKVERTEKI